MYKLIWISLILQNSNRLSGTRSDHLYRPGSSDPFYIVTYYMKSVTTSWTYRSLTITWITEAIIYLDVHPRISCCRDS